MISSEEAGKLVPGACLTYTDGSPNQAPYLRVEGEFKRISYMSGGICFLEIVVTQPPTYQGRCGWPPAEVGKSFYANASLFTQA